MAAGRNIKGITIEIGGDTTGLQKALSDVASQLLWAWPDRAANTR